MDSDILPTIRLVIVSSSAVLLLLGIAWWKSGGPFARIPIAKKEQQFALSTLLAMTTVFCLWAAVIRRVAVHEIPPIKYSITFDSKLPISISPHEFFKILAVKARQYDISESAHSTVSRLARLEALERTGISGKSTILTKCLDDGRTIYIFVLLYVHPHEPLNQQLYFSFWTKKSGQFEKEYIRYFYAPESETDKLHGQMNSLVRRMSEEMNAEIPF